MRWFAMYFLRPVLSALQRRYSNNRTRSADKRDETRYWRVQLHSNFSTFSWDLALFSRTRSHQGLISIRIEFSLRLSWPHSSIFSPAAVGRTAIFKLGMHSVIVHRGTNTIFRGSTLDSTSALTLSPTCLCSHNRYHALSSGPCPMQL